MILDEIIPDIGRGKPFPMYFICYNETNPKWNLFPTILMASNYTKSRQQAEIGQKSLPITVTLI